MSRSKPEAHSAAALKVVIPPRGFRHCAVAGEHRLRKTDHGVTPIQTKGNSRRNVVLKHAANIYSQIVTAAIAFHKIAPAKMHQPRTGLQEEPELVDLDANPRAGQQLCLAEVAGGILREIVEFKLRCNR